MDLGCHLYPLTFFKHYRYGSLAVSVPTAEPGLFSMDNPSLRGQANVHSMDFNSMHNITVSTMVGLGDAQVNVQSFIGWVFELRKGSASSILAISCDFRDGHFSDDSWRRPPGLTVNLSHGQLITDNSQKTADDSRCYIYMRIHSHQVTNTKHNSHPTITLTLLLNSRETVQISSATRDLMLIQHNKFYWISNKSGVAELIWTVTNSRLVMSWPCDEFADTLASHILPISCNLAVCRKPVSVLLSVHEDGK